MTSMIAIRGSLPHSTTAASIAHLKFGVLALFMLQLGGCATPSERFAAAAEEFGFTDSTIAGNPYRHRLYLNEPARRSQNYAELHVYLDGDGTPWEMKRWIADDPTPRNPLILHLMAQDSAPSIVLGRPCYYGFSKTPECDASLWTSHRYSNAVVTSIAAALRNWLKRRHADRLVLIGYSGGGTLAVLLAPDLDDVAAIVTVAANLDVDAWSEHHGYLPLGASLNPIDRPPLPSGIAQIHLAGLNDDNVPAAIIESFSKKQARAHYMPIAGYDHACCWADIWPDLLRRHLDH